MRPIKWEVARVVVLLVAGAAASGGCPPHVPPPSGCINVGEACGRHEDCCSIYCFNQKCDLPPLQACTVDADCPNHGNTIKACHDGKCVWSPPTVDNCLNQPNGTACSKPPTCYATGKCQAGACVGDKPAVGTKCNLQDHCFQWICDAGGACVHQTAPTETLSCECKLGGNCINGNVCLRVTTGGPQCVAPPNHCSFCIHDGMSTDHRSDCYGNGATCPN